MAESSSPRHSLPFLAVAQAHKEITHNEALARIDALLHPVVEGRAGSAPSLTANDAGQCWLVEIGATDEWQGKDGQIAYWTGASWRYVPPTQAMRVRSISTNSEIVRIGNDWIDAPAIADPQSGTVIDVEARASIVALLSHFKTIGYVIS